MTTFILLLTITMGTGDDIYTSATYDTEQACKDSGLEHVVGFRNKAEQVTFTCLELGVEE